VPPHFPVVARYEGNLKVYDCVNKGLPLVPILSRLNPFYVYFSFRHGQSLLLGSNLRSSVFLSGFRGLKFDVLALS